LIAAENKAKTQAAAPQLTNSLSMSSFNNSRPVKQARNEKREYSRFEDGLNFRHHDQRGGSNKIVKRAPDIILYQDFKEQVN
jgi:hypothetical protein